MATHISSSVQWRQLTSSSSIVVADFYADWCGPCKMIAPTFESLATKYAKPGRIAFAKVNVDNQREVAQQYGVRAMPTFVVLKNGSVIDTIQGANPPALTAAVEKAVKLAAPGGGSSFSTPGRTLGSASSAGSGSAGSRNATGGTPFTRDRPARGPVQGSTGAAWDLNSMINSLIIFVGLYFVSLFSFDPYMAAQNSKYNVQTPTAPIRVSSGPAFGGRQFAQPESSSGSTVHTLADLDAE